jgi:hypothetical protein
MTAVLHTDCNETRRACFVRTITILAHTGIVIGLAGLFFGTLAWVHNSPYGLPMCLGSLALLGLSTAFGWYYGFSPMWQPRGWEDRVAHAGKTFVVSTQQYPPYMARPARRAGGAQFGTAVYPLEGEEVADDAQALYGMQWREQRDAEEGHRWVVHTLREGQWAELEDFRVRLEQ